MTRLFLRFYLGVIVILLISWLILGYIYRLRAEAENRKVIEQALSGGVRLAEQQWIAALAKGEDVRAEEFEAIQKAFEYPVYTDSFATLSVNDTRRQRLLAGEVVFGGDRMLTLLPDKETILGFGPLPRFVGPSQLEAFAGLGSIFAFSAVAIALLLRPVAVQLRAVERTATAIAEGDLTARIDQPTAHRRLPLAKAFNSMADRIETLLRNQRELLQAVSHELRTPLARIRFAAELISSSKTDEDRSKRLTSVDQATQELDDLVGELLTYVRMESAATNSHDEAFDIVENLCDLRDSLAPLYPEVQFFVADESETVFVAGNANSLTRVLRNLLCNAGRYAESKVEAKVHKTSSKIVITVEDDGLGIPAADREKVFDPFVRLDHSKGNGSGLGLALVQRIVLSHGGTVTALCSDLGGAKIAIELPQMPPADEV
ncbi:Sensor protein RstB [Roseimaritima multifibrata]|uniref:histidine kinase n=1 Tax=Roseimaritima multifibrata TaxID=1930274 RepID=A0A517MLD9_9BACT|nr:ATP-binding protein [Roseimaritima multifibrata]QDS95701.1 Sensor protein RstB [Roseimaritima multifibrata]